MSFFDIAQKLHFRETIEDTLYNKCSLSMTLEDKKGIEVNALISFPDNPTALDENTSQQSMTAKIFIKSLDNIGIDVVNGLRGMYLKDLEHITTYQIIDYQYVNDYVKCELAFIEKYHG